MPKKLKKSEPISQPSGVVLEAFGEPDDHLRLSTLIADALAKSASALLRGKALRLSDPRVGPLSWRERRTNFVDLVRLIPAGTLVLRDPDAFAETYALEHSADWDDAKLFRERSDFFDTLRDPIDRGAIGVERTAPDPRLSRRLPTSAGSAKAGQRHPADPYASAVGADARGALDWLLRQQRLREDAVDELIDAGVGPELDRHLLLVAYDHLPHATRAAAYRLAVLRGEQALNGAIGPFAVQAKPAPVAVARAQIDNLLECGFLRRTATEGQVRMPRIVREVILARADADDPDSVAGDHKHAFESLERTDSREHVASAIERHHHAVHGLLVRQAIATATFYATDLRELAIRLSRKEHWLQAANVYREIVRRDPDDAYAWEYLAYNLARDKSENVSEIDAAYERAYALEPTNPLYHGRLLGFRGRMGKDIVPEFEHWIGVYDWYGVDRFASEVIKGLKRGGRQPVATRMIAANPRLLKHHEIRRLVESGRRITDEE
jgi:hypothetical protein